MSHICTQHLGERMSEFTTGSHIIQKEKQMLLVTNNSVFYHVGCDRNLVFWSSSAFSSSLDYYYIFWWICITTGDDEPGDVYGDGYEKHDSMYLLHFVIRVLLFLFFFLFFFFFCESPEKLWILFSDTVLSTSCKYFTSTKKPNNMFCSFTTNKKILLFYVAWLVFFFYYYF